MDFYELIEQDIKDETKDNEKYLKLAKMAPTEKARKILTDIASEEHVHMMFLKEILKDKVSSEKNESKSDSESADIYEDSKNSYPSHIENAGVDPDEFMD